MDLKANIERIAAYTAAHESLSVAHHFLYDLRRPANGKPEYVVMGVNPGETARDWRLSPTPTEETSRFDFHGDTALKGSAARWSSLTDRFLGGADYVLAELFLWSSRDMTQFRQRFGPIEASPHLAFCRDMNRDIISAYAPKAVIAPGIGTAALVSGLYGLTYEKPIKAGNVRVAERYTDGVRSWLFTIHWTGYRGFSDCLRNAVKDAIATL